MERPISIPGADIGSRVKWPRAARVAVMVALLGALLHAGVVHAKKTESGIGCDPYPGTTTIIWHSSDHYTRMIISWAFELLDENGELVSVTPVGTPIDLNLKYVKSPYSTPTPAGANLWSMEFFDKDGAPIAIGGGTCI